LLVRSLRALCYKVCGKQIFLDRLQVSTPLKASVSALRTDGAAQSPARRELLAIVEQETDRLNRLVSEALHMVRTEASKLTVKPPPIRNLSDCTHKAWPPVASSRSC